MPQADRFLNYPVRDTAAGMKLQSSIQPGDTTFSVNRITGFGDEDTPFLARLWAKQPEGFREDFSEIVKVTAVDSQNNNLTVERNAGNTGALSAGSGDLVQPMILKESMFDDIGSNIFKMSVETGEIESAKSSSATFEANVLKFEDFAFGSDEASVKWNYGQTGNNLSNVFDSGDSANSPQKVSRFTSGGTFDGSEVSYSPLTESSSNVFGLAIGGGYAAYGGNDDNTYVHNLSDGSLKYTLSESSNNVRSVAIGNGYIAYATENDVYVYNLSDASLKYTISRDPNFIYDVAIGEGFFAYTLNDDNTYVHNLSDGNLVYTLSQASDDVFTTDIREGYIAYGSNDDNTYVHDLSDGSLEYTLSESSSAIFGVSIADGYVAYVGNNTQGTDTEAYVHDLTDGSLVYAFSGTSDNLREVSIGEGYVAYGGESSNVYVHSLSDGSLEQTLIQASDNVLGVDIGEGYIAYGGADSDTYIHNGADGLLNSDTEYQYQAVIEADEEIRRGKIQRFGTDFFPKTKRETGSSDSGELETLHGELELVTESNADVSFEYGKKGLGFPNSTPKQNLGQSTNFQSVPSTFDGSETSYSPLTESSNNIRDIAIGEGYIVYGGSDNNCYVHNLNDGSLEYKFTEGGSNAVLDVAIGGGEVAYGKSETVYVHNLYDGSLKYELKKAPQTVRGVSIGEGYVAYSEASVYVHNLSNGTEASYSPLTQGSGDVNDISIGENYIAYGGSDDNTYVHNLNDGSLKYTLAESSDNVRSVDIGERYIASGSNDNDTHIYDLSDGSLKYTLTESSDNVRSVAIGDGYAAYGGSEERVWVHDLSNGSLVYSFTFSSASNYLFGVDIGEGYIAAGGNDTNTYVYNGPQSKFDRSSKYEYRAVAESNEKTRKGIVRDFTTTS